MNEKIITFFVLKHKKITFPQKQQLSLAKKIINLLNIYKYIYIDFSYVLHKCFFYNFLVYFNKVNLVVVVVVFIFFLFFLVIFGYFFVPFFIVLLISKQILALFFCFSIYFFIKFLYNHQVLSIVLFQVCF